MSVLAKSLIAIVAAGTISTGSYFLASSLKSPETIEESLVSNGFRILDLTAHETESDKSKDYAGWSDKVSKFKAEGATDKFSDLTLGDNISNNIKALKDKCREVLKVSLSEKTGLEEKQKQAEKWCSVKDNS